MAHEGHYEGFVDNVILDIPIRVIDNGNRVADFICPTLDMNDEASQIKRYVLNNAKVPSTCQDNVRNYQLFIITDKDNLLITDNETLVGYYPKLIAINSHLEVRCRNSPHEAPQVDLANLRVQPKESVSDANGTIGRPSADNV